MVSTSEGSRKSFYGRTPEDVRRQIVEALHARQTSEDRDSALMSVGQFLDMWLEDRQATSKSPDLQGL